MPATKHKSRINQPRWQPRAGRGLQPARPRRPGRAGPATVAAQATAPGLVHPGCPGVVASSQSRPELGQGAGDLGPDQLGGQTTACRKAVQAGRAAASARRDRGRRGAGMRTSPGNAPGPRIRRTDDGKSNNTSGKVIHNSKHFSGVDNPGNAGRGVARTGGEFVDTLSRASDPPKTPRVFRLPKTVTLTRVKQPQKRANSLIFRVFDCPEGPFWAMIVFCIDT